MSRKRGRVRGSPTPSQDSPGHGSPSQDEPASLLPSLREVVNPRGPWPVPLLLLLASHVAAWVLLPFAAEDAYITFRYARHLASGSGLVYNPGAHVFGFSSPIWTLWSALGFALFHDPVVWTRATSFLADLLTLLLVGRLLEREAAGPESNPRAATVIFGCFFGAWPYFAMVAMSGMEMPGMLALMALGAALARRGSKATGPALGLLALWRPEGLAAAAVLALGAKGRDRWIALAIAAVGVGALTWYFGSPVPQSVLAKTAVYGTPGPWARRYWWTWLLPVILVDPSAPSEGRLFFPFAVLAAPAILLGARVLWERRQGALARFIAACVVVWLGYAALGVAYFYWYLFVPIGGFVALAAIGLPRLLRGRLVYAAAGLLLLSSWSAGYLLYVGRAQSEVYAFAQTAEYLRRTARPGEKVLLEPIGMVGYRCPLVVVDEIGLVSPGVARRRLAGPGWYADIEALERPDWLVVRQGVLTTGQAFAGVGAPFRSTAERDSLLAHYAVANRVDEPSPERTLVILRRVRS